MRPPVSVCIAAYNAEGTIRSLIESLLELDYPEYEVVIVDDGSNDGTLEIVESYSKKSNLIRLIRQPNQGASAARNRALEAATYEIVAYTDSDTTVSPQWLEHLVTPFDDPSVGATTGRTVFETNGTCTSWMRSVDMDLRYRQRRRYTRLANGPNCAFRRSVLLEVGGFDPTWYHAEDTAVSYEVYNHGYVIRHVPEAVVYHVPEDDWRDYLRKRHRDAKAFTRVLFTHPRDAAIEDDFVPLSWKVQPPLFALLLLGIPLTLLMAPAGPAVWLGMLVVGVVINLPFAARVTRRSRRLHFLVVTLIMTTLRGFAWGLGLLMGGVSNSVEYGTVRLPR